LRRIGLRAVTLLIALTPAASLRAEPDPAAAKPASPYGALWVSAVGAQYRDALRYDRFIDELRETPFSEFLIQVRGAADAYYASKLVPRANGVPERFDPLASLADDLHKSPKPRKLIAWFDPYRVGNVSDAATLDPAHVLVAHRDWLNVRADGGTANVAGEMALEPGLPAVRQHLEAVVAELVANYKIDGVYFDRIGDPPGDGLWGCHPEILDRWRRESGRADPPAANDPQWCAFRARIHAEALAGMVAAARRQRPDLIVGVGVDAVGAPPASLDALHTSAAFRQTRQDWNALRAIDGVSRIYVRDFKIERSDKAGFDGWLEAVRTLAAQPGPDVVLGVSGESNEALDALSQLRRAAAVGVDGLALWHYGQPVSDRGSRDLFYGAVSRTIFSADVLREVAGIRAAREPVRLSVITKEPELRNEPVEIAATVPDEALAGEDLALPPPPEMEDPIEVIERGASDADFFPADAPPDDAPGVATTDPKDETMAALDRLIGITTQTNTTAPPKPVDSRLSLIEDLLNDPEFRQTADYQALWTTDAAAVELRRKFGNIF
jgi:uncharacterized lipoprotein YddW (UPF0748 family)